MSNKFDPRRSSFRRLMGLIVDLRLPVPLVDSSGDSGEASTPHLTSDSDDDEREMLRGYRCLRNVRSRRYDDYDR